MQDDPKQPLNFRLGLSCKEALERLAEEQDKPVSQLVREVVETYVADQARAAWEAEARRQAAALAEAARDPGSEEADMLRFLDASLEEFAKTWVWEEGGAA
jgi:predicted DNA-binding protein